jgi:DNA-binding transcriptional LysR family regulator
VELRHLRYFIAVAEELNFGRAAQRLGITGPSLSQQIKALERDLRVRLLDRDSHSVRLTASGAALLPSAHAILDQADNMRQQVIGLSSSEYVRFGYVSWLPTNLRDRTGAVADVLLDSWVMPSHVQATRVAEGGIDLAICWVQTTDLAKLSLDAGLIRAEQLYALSVAGGETSPVGARDTVVLIDADAPAWSSWNRYGEHFAESTGAKILRTCDGGIAGPLFYEHVRRLGQPVISAPQRPLFEIPDDLVQRSIVRPQPIWTWSLVWRRAENREPVRAIITELMAGTLTGEFDGGTTWVPVTDPYREGQARAPRLSSRSRWSIHRRRHA